MFIISKLFRCYFGAAHRYRRGESLIIWAGLCALALISASLSAAPLPVIEFSIKPNLCVLSDGEESCHDTLMLKWHSDEPRNLCLYQGEKRLPLRCWEGETEGNHYVEITVKQNIDFQLREIGDEELLARGEFQVVQDNVKYRHRRRNAWSFF